MSECAEITAAIKDLSARIERYQSSVISRLRNLESKVSGLDQDIKKIIPKVNSHDRRIKELEENSNSISVTDKNKIKRIDRDNKKLKQQIDAIERYINALDRAGSQISSIILQIAKVFSIF